MTQIKCMQIYSTLNTFHCKMYTNKKKIYLDFLIGILERYKGHVNNNSLIFTPHLRYTSEREQNIWY